MIPQRNITVGSWSGEGWIVMDEETGAAGYMICGGVHGDNAVLSGGSLTQIVRNLVHLYEKLFTLIKLIIVGGGPIGVGFVITEKHYISIACNRHGYVAFVYIISVFVFLYATWHSLYLCGISRSYYCFRRILRNIAKNTEKRIRLCINYQCVTMILKIWKKPINN